jgi:hypothetical protein
VPRQLRNRWWIPAVALFLEAVASSDAGAGDVEAKLNVTRLVLRGSVEDDDIIMSSDSAGNVTVEGFGTTVNGQPAATFAAPNAAGFDEVVVDLGKGDDTFDPVDLTAGKLRVDMGPGDDSVFLEQVTLRGDCVLAMGPGWNVVDAFEMAIAGRLRIMAGSGEDDVTLAFMSVNGPTRIGTAGGFDIVTIGQAASFDGPVKLAMGRDDDGLDLFESDFDDAVRLRGGPGFDLLFEDQNTFAEPPKVSGFE